ncbi:hypothetical protein Cs7R123_11700 [Catellatospora sp. TT07R-123]|uniref:hypothetical protein n=1 Tax=Catellatospora sp. TT07R-123 TaxID=2733863 RepID=UPI001B087B56|nr:hypothetical protein [Catellatospora sp. TT07R-123]GHJ43828.1 hypothetical protein Cs7R123_11700 [Catellatospora sp. TT07R-123]
MSRRDAGLSAAVLGFFAASWFGWAQADPPAWAPAWLGAASGLCWLVAAAGLVLGLRSRDTAPRERATWRRFGVVVGIEFAAAGAGAGLLAALGQADYIPVWVCAVVGVHFLPLVPIFGYGGYRVLAAVLTAGALVSLTVAATTDVAPSTVTGVVAGTVLLGFAVSDLARLRLIAPEPAA